MVCKLWNHQKNQNKEFKKPWVVGLYTNLISVLNNRLEEFERLNALSKKVYIPPEKSMTRVSFHRLAAKSEHPKIKVKGPLCQTRWEEW